MFHGWVFLKIYKKDTSFQAKIQQDRYLKEYDCCKEYHEQRTEDIYRRTEENFRCLNDL